MCTAPVSVPLDDGSSIPIDAAHTKDKASCNCEAPPHTWPAFHPHHCPVHCGIRISALRVLFFRFFPLSFCGGFACKNAQIVESASGANGEAFGFESISPLELKHTDKKQRGDKNKRKTRESLLLGAPSDGAPLRCFGCL